MRNRQAVLACTFGVLALTLIGCSPKEDVRAGADPEVLDRVARAIGRAEDRVTAESLADRLIKRSGDFVLYDLREPSAYEQGHIDTAQNIALPELISTKGRGSLPAGQRVILYSADGSTSAQAAALLRVAGYDAYGLEGGYSAWLRYTSGATGQAETVEEAQAMAKRQAVSCYFAGDYVAEAGLAVKGSEGGGFVPPTEPAGGEADPLGLGLGLGLGPESAQPAQQAPATDPLGLGLGLDSGGGTTPAAGGGTPGTLNIGEGC